MRKPTDHDATSWVSPRVAVELTGVDPEALATAVRQGRVRRERRAGRLGVALEDVDRLAEEGGGSTSVARHANPGYKDACGDPTAPSRIAAYENVRVVAMLPTSDDLATPSAKGMT